MTTPQYIPPEFQDAIDLPAPGSTPGNVAGAQAQLSSRNAQVAAEQARLKSLQAAAAQKGISAASKSIRDHRVADAQKSLAAAQASQAAAQNAVYEASGQYDKLLQGPNRDAFMALRSMFAGFGLESLAGKIYEFAKQGYGADTISLLLQDTPEYKERFAANETRRKNGLPVLSPAEYLSVESAYRQLLQDSGMPKGFYDNPADFRAWIASDVSPTEVKGRVDLAVASTSQANPYTKQQLAALYGVDESYLTAYFFDRTKSLPLLQKQQKTAEFAAEAARRGLLTDRDRFEGYITQGLSQSAASQGFQIIADELPNLDAIAARFGTTFGQVEAEGAVFGTSQAAGEKRKGLASQERALFSGRQGASAGGLSAGYRAT